MMCCQSDKSVGLVSAINSLVQSAACVTFGIVTILMYKCVLTPTPPQLSDASVMPSPLSAFSSSFYLQYFHSQNNCIAHNTYIWKDVNDTVTGVVTKSYQVHGIFIGYIVENGLWLLCTALLFFGSAIKSQWIYRTYSAIQFTVILYDAILIVLFGLDFKSYREFQGNTKTPLITKSSMLVNIIVMMLIVSRFVFFFILNIILSCYLHSSGGRLGSSKIIPFDTVHGNSPPNSPRRKKEKSKDHQHSPTQYYYPGARVETPKHLQPSIQQQLQPFVLQTYQIPRYPDVIGHPNFRHDSSSEEVLVSASSMPNVSRLESIPVMNREPRNLELNRQPIEAWASPTREITNEQPISRGNQLRPSERGFPNVDYDSSSSIGGLSTETSYSPRRRPKRGSIASSYQGSPSKVSRSTGNIRESSGTKLRRDSSGRSDASNRHIPEQLKNQRPWSYISPADIPKEPNKLNQFYNNHLVPNQEKSTSTQALTSITDEKVRDVRSQRSASRTNQQQLKREYNYDTVASAEVRQPLLAETRFPLYQPQKHPEPVYANLQTPPVKKKKNVRFNQRTHSLELLETSFPVDSPRDTQVKDNRIKADQRRPRDSKKSTGRGIRTWKSSGDELCTDEFFIFNCSEYTDQHPVAIVEALNPNKTRLPTRQLSSVSSPNLVFDPMTNTARLVFESKSKQPTLPVHQDRCKRQGACVIHASTCDGRSCATAPWDETSI